MNVLIIDADRVALDFAMRCAEAGHSVKTFMRPQRGERVKAGDGIIEKVTDWEKWMVWADLIVPTVNSFYMDRLEYYRGLRYPIFGASKQSAALEIERGYGMQMLKKHGIDVPPFKMFHNLDEAEKHCWKSDRRYVFKTLGSEEDKALTYVARDCADMISTIRRWKKAGKVLKGACMLQDVIEGIEFGVSRWMGADGFFGPYGENVEHKKLMSGDYGQNTGEMGTLMWYTQKSKLGREVVDPLEPFLLSIGHRGDLDVNCIVDPAGKVWPLEFTARLGWPAFFVMQAQHEEPCEWMRNGLDGRDTFKASEDAFIGCVLAIPPFPNKGGTKDATEGIPVRGITDANWPSVHLAEVRMGKDVDTAKGKPAEKEMFVTTGEYVMVVTGSGSTIRKARRDVYKNVEEIHLNNVMCRDDIGLKFIEQLPELQKHGYATGVSA